MKNYEFLQLQNFVDPGGYANLKLQGSKLQYKNQEWKYLASGLSRDVFVSEDGKSVLKIPQRVWNRDNEQWGLDVSEQWEYDHNRLEFQCYEEAPEWCKKYIAKTELTEHDLVIQEYVDVRYIGDAYWRELGYREDGTCVIFDCDIFLDTGMKRPTNGFKYEDVFGARKGMFGDCYEIVENLTRETRRREKAAVAKYFPGVLDGSHFISSRGGYGGQHIYVIPKSLSRANLSKEEEAKYEIDLNLALECGFISEIFKDGKISRK